MFYRRDAETKQENSSPHESTRSSPYLHAHRRQWSILIAVLVMLDGLAVWGSLTLAYFVRLSSGWLTYSSSYEPLTYLALAWAALPAWWALLAFAGAYRRDHLLGGVVEYERVVRASTAGIVALIILSFWWRDALVVSRGWLLLAWGLSCFLLVLERFLVRRVVYRLRRLGCFISRVLIVGANAQGIAIASHWSHSPASGMQVVGFVDDFKPVGTPVVDGLQVVGQPLRLAEIAHRYRVHEAVVVPNAVSWETFEELVAQAGAANGYAIRLSPGSYELLTTGVTVTEKSFVPLVTINESRIVGTDALLKMALDYGLGLPLLLLSSPALVLIALILGLGRERGPALRRFTVLGQGRKPFVMLKFRSRARGTDDPPGKMSFPLASLVTWLEHVLYDSGLDKLPQLLNVVAGQMSLVGPRPRLLGEGTSPHTSNNLCTVKPGIIGPWLGEQDRSPQQEQRNDLYYIRNWTIWLDLQSIFRALKMMGRARKEQGSTSEENEEER